jgi:hypothetical protein
MADDLDRRPLIYIGDSLLKQQGMKTRAEADALYESIIAMTVAQSPGTTEADFLFVRGTAVIWPEDLAERAAAEAAGPGVAQEAPGDLDGPLASPRSRSNFVTHNNADHQSDEALGQGVSTPPPGGRSALPATLQDIQASRARAQQFTEVSAHHLGLRLPADAKGVCFNDVWRVAAALRATATLLPGGEIMLESKFGKRHCASFSVACQLLNGRTFGQEIEV